MKQEYKDKAISFFEDTIVILVMFTIFLPVRLFFVTYISTDWIGSFGVITLVVTSLVLLSKYNKLGFFGRVYWRTITKVHKGKRRILSYSMIAISLYLWASIVVGVNMQDDPQVQELIDKFNGNMTPEQEAKLERLEKAVSEKNVIETQKTLQEGFEKVPTEILILTALLIVALPIIDPVIWSAMVTMLDTWLNGWLLHFGTVFLVELLEVVGIMIYTGVVTRKADIKPNKP